METVWLAFIPLFVAFDVPGVMPIYWTLAQGLPVEQRRAAVHRAVAVGFIVALAFLWVSGIIFRILGIRIGDVMIAGGITLFVLALRDLLQPEKLTTGSVEAIGVVPLGVPLIVGPAVLTTVLLLRQRYGVLPTVAALAANSFLSWLALQVADRLMDRIGRVGANVVSKVFSLILAAFAVMLIRQGLATVSGAGG